MTSDADYKVQSAGGPHDIARVISQTDKKKRKKPQSRKEKREKEPPTDEETDVPRDAAAEPDDGHSVDYYA